MADLSVEFNVPSSFSGSVVTAAKQKVKFHAVVMLFLSSFYVLQNTTLTKVHLSKLSYNQKFQAATSSISGVPHISKDLKGTNV
jgi:hypothetical protein